jgi:hypothetical protein
MLNDPYEQSILHVETILCNNIVPYSACHIGYKQKACTGLDLRGGGDTAAVAPGCP